MPCVIDITDIVDEQAIGSIVGVAGLSVDQTSGILAGLSRAMDQDAGVVSIKGLGRYGLFLSDLQVAGVIKNCIAATVNSAMVPSEYDPVTGLPCLVSTTEYLAMLSDPSVFTGKDGVNKVADLLGNERIQQEIINTVITKKMVEMVTIGIITGNETDEELSFLAGLAAKFGLADISAKLSGVFDGVGNVLGVAMDSLGAIAALGALVATIKGMDILGKIKGFAGLSISEPEQAVDTIDQESTHAGADSIVGSSKIQSAADAASSGTTPTPSTGLPTIPTGEL